jgi:hypothetical protein
MLLFIISDMTFSSVETTLREMKTTLIYELFRQALPAIGSYPFKTWHQSYQSQSTFKSIGRHLLTNIFCQYHATHRQAFIEEMKSVPFKTIRYEKPNFSRQVEFYTTFVLHTLLVSTTPSNWQKKWFTLTVGEEKSSLLLLSLC